MYELNMNSYKQYVKSELIINIKKLSQKPRITILLAIH